MTKVDIIQSSDIIAVKDFLEKMLNNPDIKVKQTIQTQSTSENGGLITVTVIYETNPIVQS